MILLDYGEGEAGEQVRIDSRVILMGFQQGAGESRGFLALTSQFK